MSDRGSFRFELAIMAVAVGLLIAGALYVNVFAESVPERIDRAAVVHAPASRGVQVQTKPLPTTTTDPGPTGLEGCELMRWHRVNVGLPAVFDRIVYRESRCQADPSVRTFCCHGPLQLYVSLHLRDHRLGDRYRACGVHGVSDVNGPEDLYRHYCAARVLYDVMGTDPWRATR